MGTNLEYGSISDFKFNTNAGIKFTTIELHDGSLHKNTPTVLTAPYDYSEDNFKMRQKVVVVHDQSGNIHRVMDPTTDVKRGSGQFNTSLGYITSNAGDPVYFSLMNIFILDSQGNTRGFDIRKDPAYRTGDIAQYEAVQIPGNRRRPSRLCAVRVFIETDKPASSSSSIRSIQREVVTPQPLHPNPPVPMPMMPPVKTEYELVRGPNTLLFTQEGILIERDENKVSCVIYSRDLGRVHWKTTRDIFDDKCFEVGKWVFFNAQRCHETNHCSWVLDNIQPIKEPRLPFKRQDWATTFVVHSCKGIVMNRNDQYAILWNEKIGRVYINKKSLGGQDQWERSMEHLGLFERVVFRACVPPPKDCPRDLCWVATEIEPWPDDEDRPKFPTLQTFSGHMKVMNMMGSLAFLGCDQLGTVTAHRKFEYYSSNTDVWKKLSDGLYELVYVPALKQFEQSTKFRALYLQPMKEELPTLKQLGFFEPQDEMSVEMQDGEAVEVEDELQVMAETQVETSGPQDEPQITADEPQVEEVVVQRSAMDLLSDSGPWKHLSPPQRSIELFKWNKSKQSSRAVVSQTCCELEVPLFRDILGHPELKSAIDRHLPNCLEMMTGIVGCRSPINIEEGSAVVDKHMNLSTQTPILPNGLVLDQLLANQEVFNVLMEFGLEDQVMQLSQAGILC